MLIRLSGREPLQRTELEADYVDDRTTLVLDTRCLQHAGPLELAAMVSMSTSAAHQNREVTLFPPYDQNVASYLTRMNVIEHLKGVATVEGPTVLQARQDRSETLLEVTQVTPGNADDVAQALGRVAIRRFGRRVGTAVYQSLGELIGNATTHGLSSAGAFVAAQLYTGATSGRPGLEVAVCDSGIGILEHLRTSTRHQSISDGPSALERALARALASSGADAVGGRGNGLGNLGHHTKRGGGGRLVLRSSGAVATVELDGNRPTLCKSVATTLDGTWASLRVRLP